MSAATALNNACSVSNITEGLEPLHMLNQEISNRWQVMGAVVSRRKKVIDSTLKQMKHYKDVVEKVDETLTRTEATLTSQHTSVFDVNKAKASRETLKVSVLCQ